MDEVAKVSDQGRMLAGLSYLGLFLGWPLALIPLFDRKDAFALFHAKCAMVVVLEFLALFGLYFVIFAIAMVLGFLTCGFANFVTVPLLFVVMPLIALPVVPAAHGLVLALHGEARAPFGTFGLDRRLFAGVVAEAP